MSLITPTVRDSDVVFPGEGWFFYWKTSSSLWKSKVEQLHQGNVLVIPINWAFHSEMGDDIDFAQNRPETNLKKLVEIAFELKKEVIFLLPLTPAPFLLNGGVPNLLARDVAEGKDGLAYTIVDSERNLHRIFSFFNPNIFKKWSLFVTRLAEYFSQQGIACDVKGLISGYFDDEKYRSFAEDKSSVFENSFSKFLAARKEEAQAETSSQIASPTEENVLKEEFSYTITKHYHNFAKRALAANWSGTLKSAFLGGSIQDNVNRIGHHYDFEGYIQDFFHALTGDIFPSSVLLPSNVKEGAFGQIITDLIDYNYKRSTYCNSFQDEDGGASLRPLTHFVIADHLDVFSGESLWNKYAFWDYIYNEFRWSIIRKPFDEIHFDEESLDLEKIYCFLGETLTDKSIRNVLKIFMLGGQVLLDRNNLDKKLIQRLEGFFIENSLSVEKVNFHTEVHNLTLGAGRLVIFDGSKLSTLAIDKKLEFWNQLLKTFSLLYLPLSFDEDVEYFWRTRMSTPSELSFQEVRRLGIYNSSSYKKRVVVPHFKHFALKKVIDELDVAVTAKAHELEIDLKPGGSVSLEFGVFT